MREDLDRDRVWSEELRRLNRRLLQLVILGVAQVFLMTLSLGFMIGRAYG
jgi:hypothetical protein